MRLRRVKIYGFKTFAERTEFELDGGLVAVVGSNGCGKSNLVDAILWGLGEGNSRHLRAATGQDVIFNGAPNRKPVGFAEVALTFDNEDGTLPTSASEVTLSRKLNRGGDAEYRINRSECRQRDVYELLADSGLGRSGYSIVGQREIDSALSASPEERRSWVDEAAGVQRYRQRRTEAMRRLESAKEHLQRTLDILNELNAQREPLRKEAEIAIRYKSCFEAFQKLDRSLLFRDANQAIQELLAIENRVSEIEKLVLEQQQKELKLELESTQLGQEISTLEEKLDSFKAIQHRCLTSLERLEGERNLLLQKIQSLDSTESDLLSDGATLEARIKDAEAELLVATKELEAETLALKSLQDGESGISSIRKELTYDLQIVESELQKAKQLETIRIKQEVENAQKATKILELNREKSGIQKAMPDLIPAVDEANLKLSEIKSKVEECRNQIKFSSELLAKKEIADRTFESDLRAITGEKAKKEARRDGIAATIEANEGLSIGAKSVLDAVARGNLKAEYTPVANAIRATENVALAIEVALGASANDLITNSDKDAKTAIQFLKETHGGRATFQPIPLIRPSFVHSELKSLVNDPAVVGRASELVETEVRFQIVIESLLGRVLIVRNIDDALRIAKGGNRSFGRLVTLDGEVVHSSGSVTGGASHRTGIGIVQRQAQLDSIETEIADLLKDIESKTQSHQTHEIERNRANLKIADLKKYLDTLSEEYVEAQNVARVLSQELSDCERGLSRLEREIEQCKLVDLIPQSSANIEELEQARQEKLTLLAASSADAQQFTQRLQELKDRFARAKAREESATRRVQSAKDSEIGRANRLANIAPEREELQAKVFEKESEQSQLKITLVEAENELRQGGFVRKKMLEDSLGKTEDLRACRESASVLATSGHRLEVDKARWQTKKATVLERLVEDYNIQENELENLSELNLEQSIPSDSDSILQRMKREIKAMGEVNLGSIDAFERLTGRYTELEAQQLDIAQGISEVENSIAELDAQTKDRFVTALEATQLHFSLIFQRLFGGGEGVLTLTNEDDVLNSGLEMSVTIPGKRRQPLALLSGGERSLCALAFLFALLEVKSSPLVVLDEVDAPLDGGNVERFVQLLQDYSKKIQFIVITHNPVTIAAAPIWLGVTMKEPGCSSLIPYRTNKTNELASISAHLN